MMIRGISYIMKARLVMIVLLIIPGHIDALENKGEPAALAPLREIPQLITLKKAFEKALSHDLQLKLANNRLHASRAQKISRIAALLPKIKSNLRYTRNIPESKASFESPATDSQALLYRKVAAFLAETGRAGAEELESAADRLLRRPVFGEIITKPAHVVDATLSVVIPLFNGEDVGKLSLANENIVLEQARVGVQRAGTVFSVAKAYLDAFYYQEIIALRALQSQLAAEQHQIILRRQKRGLVSHIEQLKSEQAGEELKLAKINAQFEYDRALAHLGFLIGETHEFDIIEPAPELFSFSDDNIETLIDFARSNRPDLLAQMQALRVADRERLQSVLQFFPSVSLQADANYTTNTKGLVSKELTYAIFLNAHYDFFSGGSTIGSLKESSLKKQAEVLRLQDLSQRMRAHIRGQRANIELAAKVIETLESQINYANKLETNALTQYGRGRGSIDLLLDARHVKYEAEVALKKAQADERAARLGLAHELGLLTPQNIVSMAN